MKRTTQGEELKAVEQRPRYSASRLAEHCWATEERNEPPKPSFVCVMYAFDKPLVAAMVSKLLPGDWHDHSQHAAEKAPLPHTQSIS